MDNRNEEQLRKVFEPNEVVIKAGNRSFLFVIIYDIIEDKRRTKVFKLLKGYGQWVQGSAFECHLTDRQYNLMLGELLPLIDEGIDRLRIYKLGLQNEMQFWGAIGETPDEDVVII